MKRSIGLGLMAALMLLAAAPASAAPPVVAPADRPVYAIGQVWMRDDGAYRLTRIDGDIYVFTAEAGKEVRLTRDLGLVRLERDGTYFEFEPAISLTWPLAVGRWGAGTTQRRAAGTPDGARVVLTWRVEGTDDVTIGSAKVQAFRILVHQQFTATGRQTAQRMWYAPSLGQFVRSAGDDWKTFHFAVVGLPGGSERLTGSALQPLTTELHRVKGLVEVQRGESGWRAASVGTRLGEGDQIRTAVGATAEVALPNAARVIAYERTVLTLSKLEHDPATDRRNVSVHVQTGAVRVVRGAMSRDPSRPSTFIVSSPAGVAAMRGEVDAVVSHQQKAKESVVAAFEPPAPGASAGFVTYVDYVSSGVQTIRPGHFVRQEVSKVPSRPAPLESLPAGSREQLTPQD